MKRALILVLLVMFMASPCYAKKLEDVTGEDLAVGSQTVILKTFNGEYLAWVGKVIGHVAYYGVKGATKVVTFPFKQLEKISNNSQNNT